MITQAQRSANSKALREQAQKVGKLELAARDSAIQEEGLAGLASQLQPYAAATRDRWKTVAMWYAEALLRAQQMVAIWEKSLTPEYYPFVEAWDPGWVETGQASWNRVGVYETARALAEQKSKRPNLSLPAPTPPVLSVPPVPPFQNMPTPGGGGGGGGGVITPTPVDPPGTIDPTPVDPPAEPPDIGAPLPPGEGSPVALWLVPVGLVGAVLWHLLGRKRG